MYTARECQNQLLNLSCKIIGGKLEIVSANYGRTKSDLCPDGITTDTNCTAVTSFEIVNQKCGGTQYCNVQATDEVFGNPCENTYKYLEVIYSCVKRTTRTTTSTTTTTTTTTTLPATTQKISTKFDLSLPTTNVQQAVVTSVAYDKSTANLREVTTATTFNRSNNVFTTSPATSSNTILIASTAAGVAGAIILLILIAGLVFWRKRNGGQAKKKSKQTIQDSRFREEHLDPTQQSDEAVYTMQDNTNQSDTANQYLNLDNPYGNTGVETTGNGNSQSQMEFYEITEVADSNEVIYSGVTSSGGNKETVHFHKDVVNNPLYGER